MDYTIVKMSKWMSFVLRHSPQSANLTLDEAGWCDLDQLKAGAKALELDESLIDKVVETSDKKRFEIQNGKIRASQGHSVEVKLGYEPQTPPDILYHGTTAANAASIKESGINAQARHHVHLSEEISTAMTVGARRRGETTILKVDAAKMHQDGFVFYRSTNGVWLTDNVPASYVQ